MNPPYNIWHINLPMILLAVFLLFIYFMIQTRFTIKGWIFFCGIVLLLLVSISPLDVIGHNYLFSAHMVQHIVLLLIIPPLLLNGFEEDEMNLLNPPPWLKKLFSFVLHPVVAWITGIGIMWFWHIPSVFLAMKESPVLHVLHLYSLVLAGLIFIWPVHSPVRWKRLSSSLLSVLYLFMACIGCTLLGIVLTFSTKLYYVQAFIYDYPGKFLPDFLQMTPGADQQVAGLIMWVPACIIYIINSMVILGRWLKSSEPGYNE
ncbi:MAG: cytochrome c oxidase assembly protein [Syntrophothermus sp.]